jgi:hypothetical protein
MPMEITAPENGLLANCLELLLNLCRPPGEGPTDLFTPTAVFDRVFFGAGQGGEAIGLWEISRWKYRGQTEAGELSGPHADDDFLVFSIEDERPSWHVYPEPEFRRLFVQACSRWCYANPGARKAVGAALARHELHLL